MSRFKESQQSPLLIDILIAKFKARQVTARQFQIFKPSNRIYQVEQPDSSQRLIINLIETEYNCIDFYKY